MANLGQVVHFTGNDNAQHPALVARIGDQSLDLIVFDNEDATDDKDYYPSKGGGRSVKDVQQGYRAGQWHDVGDTTTLQPAETVTESTADVTFTPSPALTEPEPQPKEAKKQTTKDDVFGTPPKLTKDQAKRVGTKGVQRP